MNKRQSLKGKGLDTVLFGLEEKEERQEKEPKSFAKAKDRPVLKAEETKTRQSAVFLEERQIDWLEEKRLEARRNGGKAIRKAAIIRALLDVAMEKRVDLTGLKDEEEITQRIKHSLT